MRPLLYAPDVESTCLRPALPVDVGASLGASRRGRRDPAMWVSELEVWRATRTPDGPATMRASRPDRGGAALGDPDAIAVGDFHMPNWVAWNLAGEPRGDD